MDFRQWIGAFVLVVLAIYVANMWTAAELKKKEKAEAYQRYLEEQAALATAS